MATSIATTSSIRAVLGVSERELRDDVLLNPIYRVRLNEALLALHPSLFDDYVTAEAVPEVSRTSAQQRLVDLTQTYSAYQIASQCLGSVAMFAPIVIKDSRSELNRQDDPFAALRLDVVAVLAILKTQLLTAYNAINPGSPVPSATARIRALIAPLGVNPVTG